MNTSILLDSALLIDFIRNKNKLNTLFYKLSIKNVKLYVSIITYAELYAGKSVWERDSARIELEKLFKGLVILPINKEISKNAGRLRAFYNTDIVDALIASTAIVNNLQLVTFNFKHFKPIKELDLAT